MGTLRTINWTWESDSSDIRRAYVSIDGRISITDLIKKVKELAPGIDPKDIEINFATAVWTRPATAEELADRDKVSAAQQQRQEKWERETLARLTQKYGRP